MSDSDDLAPHVPGNMDKLTNHAADPMADIMDSLRFHHDDLQLPWDSEGQITAFARTMGTPDSDIDHWQFQTTAFTCAVMAQRGIIEAFTGEPVSEAQLVYEATSHGWLTDGGMSPNDVGNLLELHGVPCHERTAASVEDLANELAHGHKVIVGVDSGEMWKDPGPMEDFFHHAADHAIWVTGINDDDPDNPKVIINDSGDPNGAGKEYDLSRFIDAWEDSGFFYVATDHAPSNLPQLASEFDAHRGIFPEMAAYFSRHDHALHERPDAAAGSGTSLSAERMPSGEEIAGDILERVHDMVYHPDPEIVAQGQQIADRILRDVEAAVYPGDTDTADDKHGGSRFVDGTRQEDDMRLAAGTCYHCGGRGYTTWTSSGSQERCWYCGGSGVAQ